MECKIRNWELSDAAALVRILADKNIRNNLRDGIPYPYTEKDASSFLSEMLGADKNEVFPFAITVNGKLIGSICAYRCKNIHFRTAELGYYLSAEYSGKGIMTNAVKQICAYIFENTDIIRIFAEPFSRNAASCRVLEKAGFKYEGTLRRNAVKNGEIIDMKMYALLK